MRFGTQTGLCAHVFRLLRASRAPWVVLENVPGLLNWHMRDDPPQPPAISHVVSELERLGYRWAHRVVGLTGFGIPQRRRRVFVVASTHGDPRDVLLAPQAVCLGQCVEMHRREASDADVRGIVGGFETDDASRRDDEAAGVARDGGERACIECALDAVASPAAAAKSGGGGFARASACAHGARECYECFRTPPLVTPRRVVASLDLAEKRHGPMLNELFTLTTANGRRMCLVERGRDGASRRGALHIEDAERLMGLPAGWTEPAYPLNVPGKPKRNIDYNYAALLARNGRAGDKTRADPRDDQTRESRENGRLLERDRRGNLDDARAEENARRAFAQQMNEFSAATFKRFEKLGLAVAVPQARWLGERLMRPYDLKFARAGDGVKFTVAAPGGPDAAAGGVVDRRDRRVRRERSGSEEGKPFVDKRLSNETETDAIVRGARMVDDARLEAAAAASGWPDAAYNVRPHFSWRARFALPECGDAPVIRGFVPLGEFLRRSADDWPEVSREQALGYVERLRLAHMHVEPFVARALGEKPNARNADAPMRGAGAAGGDVPGDGSPPGGPPNVSDEGAVPEDGVPAGRVVWAPWLLGRGPPARRARVFWPALALHAHDDRDQIPPDAFDALAKARQADAASRDLEISSDTHVLVVYFGDKTYEWCASDSLLNFLEHRDEFAEQPLLRNRKRFLEGVRLAGEWVDEQRRLGLAPSMLRAREARARAEERLRRAVGAASGDGSGLATPASCGACGVCKRNAAETGAVSFSPRHLSRKCANRKATTANPSHDTASVCPQIGVILEARVGHVGACLTLLRERAVGRRVRVHWPAEAARGPFAGTVASFDAESLTHSIAYDDGDVEPACRLWKETVHLGVPEDARAEAEAAAEKRSGDEGAFGGDEGARGEKKKARTRDEAPPAPFFGAGGTDSPRGGHTSLPSASASRGKRKRDRPPDGSGNVRDALDSRASRAAERATSRRNIAGEAAHAREPERPRRGPGRPPASGRGRGTRRGDGARGGAEACAVG